MKFDKETIIVIGLAGLILLGWFLFFPKWQQNKIAERDRIAAEAQAAAEKQAQIDAEKAVKLQAVPAQTFIPSPAPDAAKTATPAKTVPADALKPLTLENNVLSISVVPADATLNAVTLKKFFTAGHDKTPIVTGKKSPAKTFALAPFEGFDLTSVQTSRTDDAVTVTRDFKSADGRAFALKQTYTLTPDSYQVAASFSFRSLSGKAFALPELVVWNAGLPPLKMLAGDNLYNERHNVDYCLAANQSVKTFDPAAKEEKFKAFDTNEPVAWVGSANKFFASMLFPGEAFDGGARFARTYYPVPDKKDNYSNPAIAGVYRNFMIPESGEHTIGFTYFCGPKEMSLIKQLPPSAMNAMHLSYFSWMDFLARPLVWLLNYLKQLSGSYGWAIILLTVIVRVVFWPITQKANNSMRKMQKVQPLVADIRAKYKDNPQEMNMRMMELYRKEHVNPVGGCLPILLQLPVFFALYSALDSAVELRQISFWWITDLSKPDLIGPAFNLPFLGSVGLHPLVLAMTGLMVLQQKMTPSMADPMQQKMMMLMPLIMLVMLYNLPAGLTLYWTVSQIFSIIQLKYSQYVAKREEAADAARSAGKKTA